MRMQNFNTERTTPMRQPQLEGISTNKILKYNSNFDGQHNNNSKPSTYF